MIVPHQYNADERLAFPNKNMASGNENGIKSSLYRAFLWKRTCEILYIEVIVFNYSKIGFMTKIMNIPFDKLKNIQQRP